MKNNFKKGFELIMLEEIEMYAKVEKVPIMMKDGIEYLCNYIKENNIRRIL